MDTGIKYSEKQKWNFDDATMKAGQCVIQLQMGNKCASQSGMVAYGKGKHLYDPKNHILPPRITHHQPAKGHHQVGQPGGHDGSRDLASIYDTTLGTDKCDNSSMSLQMGYMKTTNQSSQVFGLGWQIYTTPSTAHKVWWSAGLQGLSVTAQAQRRPGVTPLLPRRGSILRPPLRGISPHHYPI